MSSRSSKEREVGKVNVNFRPYIIDLKEIDALTKNEFKDNQSETVRTLVREALVHRRLVRSGRDVTMNIVRDSQKDVITNELQPLVKQIDKLEKTIETMSNSQDNLLRGVTNSTNKITGEIAVVRDEIKSLSESGNTAQIILTINKTLQNLTTMLQPLAARSADTLRNVIVMRSLFYFFLIAYQSGGIDEAYKLNKQQWVYFVRDVSKRAGQLSVDEYGSLDTIGQHKFIEDYAIKLFEQVHIIKPNDIPKLTR